MNDAIKSSLDQLNTEEIVKKVAHSMLTKEAHVIALEVLTARGVNIEDLPKIPTEDSNWNLKKVRFFKNEPSYYIFYALFAVAFLGLKGYVQNHGKNSPTNDKIIDSSIYKPLPKSVIENVDLPQNDSTTLRPKPIKCPENQFRTEPPSPFCK
jgi:hypothetical protein